MENYTIHSLTMARKPSDAKQKDLILIRDWCRTVLEFMAQKNPSHKDVFLQSKIIVENAYTEMNATGLKQLHSDIKQWAHGLSKPEKDELNAILAIEYAFTLNDERKIDLKKISKIVQAGEIRSDEEYKLIEDKVNKLSQCPSAKEENIEVLNELLSAYHAIQNHVH